MENLVILDSVTLDKVHQVACRSTFLKFGQLGWVAWLELGDRSYQVVIRDEVDSWVQSSIAGDVSTWYDDAQFSRAQHDELMDSATFDHVS